MDFTDVYGKLFFKIHECSFTLNLVIFLYYYKIVFVFL